MELHGRRVTVQGLGHFGGGAAVTRWLVGQGAKVTVTDLADQRTLRASLAGLRDVPVERFHLGGHREDDFRRADLVVVNPAVPPRDPLLAAAREAGVPVTSEIDLFLDRCRASVIGVTGTNGKSTTAAMTASILRASGGRCFLGGNIGRSLLERVDEIAPGDRVVLELSSFQLHHLGAEVRMPRVAVVTNFAANHLHWHGSLEEYRRAKQRIVTAGRPGDVLVLGGTSPEPAGWAALAGGRVVEPVSPEWLPSLAVPGEHNRANAALAAAAAIAAGCDVEAVRRGLKRFRPLAHRLQPVAARAGRRIYDDSASTTPESTMAALETLQGKTWLLAGGAGKGAEFQGLAGTIVGRARGAVFFGAVGERLLEQVRQRSPAFPALVVDTLAQALASCWQRSKPGENVLLSPGCSSHDQFQNYRHRGEVFCGLARGLSL